MATILKLSGIGKRYGAVTALDSIDFEVGEGEVVGLVGDNGAGKSTLVKTISGALHPDAGTIEFAGEIRHWQTPHDSLAAGIETLYQDGGLAPHLTISGNVYLGRELKRRGLFGTLGLLDKPRMSQRALEELRRVGIGSVTRDVPVTDLSGGQRQAVAIGRTVMWARKLILLDEPTNHLSVHASDEVLRVISQVKSMGIGVILISHTLPHVMQVTDRIVSLRLGRVVSNRPTTESTIDGVVRDITGVTSAG